MKALIAEGQHVLDGRIMYSSLSIFKKRLYKRYRLYQQCTRSLRICIYAKPSVVAIHQRSHTVE